MRAQRFFGPAALLLTGLLATAPLHTAAANDTATIASTKGFRKAVTVEDIREHQAAFQRFADQNNGTRASGTPGYEASAQYVYDRAAAVGYNVKFQEFEFPFFQQLSPAVLQQLTPNQKTYETATFTYSGSGDVSAAVTPVDVTIPPPATPGVTSGCEASDFAGFPAGNIALIQRGTCPFQLKALNAQNAGAVGVIIFNEGQPGRTDVVAGTLSAPVVSIPVVGASFTTGQELYTLALSGGVTARVKAETISAIRKTRNVIAETRKGDPNRVVVVGAHLDSVIAGPGINDNGSGSATILEVAETLGGRANGTRNKLRFIWFGAEELGLLGSRHYVNQLSQAERDQIELNLNFDMVGSPNFVRFVYDGNNSAFPVGPGAAVGPAGSGAIEELFHQYFRSQGLASAETPFSGRSDYGPFIEVGIPAGGLFTGAEGVKTAEQAAIYGGTAGVAYDPCYHQACDTFANNSNTALDQMSDAVAHAVLVFSKVNFDRQPLVDGPPSKGKGNGGEGGGLHDDHDHDELPTE
jgi:Zn-dependent M28 family amino/carboxypeptidase